MDVIHRILVPLRVALVLTFGVLVVFQTLSFPGMFAHLAREQPDLAHLRWPLTAIAALAILCAQVVIVCTWRLLTLVREGRIFSDAAVPWVDAIIGSITVAGAILAGAFCFLGFTADDPGAPLLLLFLVLAAGALGLLVAVLRELLGQATALRDERDAPA